MNAYSRVAPHPQNVLDIFAGEWVSALPPPFEHLTAGAAKLFDDPRLQWAIDRLGGVTGKRILELGSLEGGHTYMLDRAGAAEILSIEANPRAFLRSLVTKELLGIHAARFVHGDFVPYLEENRERFDITIASGVLYHMVNPVELIARVAATSDAAYFWTRYYDEALLKPHSDAARRIVEPELAEYRGYRHALYRNHYWEAVTHQGFCGGPDAFSFWLSRDDVLGAFRHFGLTRIEIAHEETHHVHGPAFAAVATR